MARRCFFTSYATFFFPQFSTLMTLPPSRCTMPRMRSTILSTRSSARSGRTRKMVSYSRSRVPGACCGGPPAVVFSACCITSPHGFAAGRNCRSRGSLRLRRTAVVSIRRHRRSFPERRDGRLGRHGDQLLQLLLFRGGKLRQHPVGALPLRRRPSHPEPDPQRLSAQVLADAAQPV